MFVIIKNADLVKFDLGSHFNDILKSAGSKYKDELIDLIQTCEIREGIMFKGIKIDKLRELQRSKSKLFNAIVKHCTEAFRVA